MRKILLIFFLIIAFIIQSTLFRYIGIYDVRPNLMLLIVITLALLNGGYYGALIGLFVGFLQDVFFSPSIGMTMIPYFIVGFFSGYYNNKVFKEKTLTAFIFTILYSLVFNFIIVFEAFIINPNIDILKNIYIALIGVIYNSIFILFIHKFIIMFINSKFLRKAKMFR